MLNDGNEGCSLGVSHLLRHFVGMRLLTNLTRLLVHILCFPYHCHTEDGCLRLGAASLRLLRFLAIVLVGFPAAKVHLVTLHHAIKNHILLCEEGANLIEDEPRGFLRHINVAAQLTRGNALLVAADKVHSHKPLLQRQFGVLKDGSHKAGETLVAMGTLELIVTITALIYMGATAERAHYHLAPTLLGDEVTATLVTVEMVDEGDKGIEMFKCKSHSLKVFTSYLYLKTMEFFQKVQRFSRWTSMFYGIIGVIRYIIPFYY